MGSEISDTLFHYWACHLLTKRVFFIVEKTFVFFITPPAEVQHCAGRPQGQVENCYLPRTLLEKKIVVPTCQSELFLWPTGSACWLWFGFRQRDLFYIWNMQQREIGCKGRMGYAREEAMCPALQFDWLRTLTAWLGLNSSLIPIAILRIKLD